MQAFNDQPVYAFCFGVPVHCGKIRVEPEDFEVIEELGFEPDGEGHHLLVSLTKRGHNTSDAATWLSALTGVPVRDIGFCGLKDRHAVTTQWFSVPGGRLDADELAQRTATGFAINKVVAHGRKLRRGAHRRNRFMLRVRELSGDPQALVSRVEALALRGAPNYFGPQRFGPDGDNVRAGLEMLLARRRPRRSASRGILMSALRSTLFNQVLSRRVHDDTWDQFLHGDVAMLAGSRSHFDADLDDPELARRLSEHDIHPTGPMWGRGRLPVTDAVRVLEKEVLKEAGTIQRALESAGLRNERRALRVVPEDMTISIEEAGVAVIGFALGRGSYATSILRELILLDGDSGPWAPVTSGPNGE